MLPKKPKEWLKSFKEKYPEVQVSYYKLDGDVFFQLKWTEPIETLLAPNTVPGRAYWDCSLEIRHPVSYKIQENGKFTASIVYPFCDLDDRSSILNQDKQLSVVLMPFVAPSPPAYPKLAKARKKSKSNGQQIRLTKPEQLRLSVAAIEQQLFDYHLKLGGKVVSAQELLEGNRVTVSSRSIPEGIAIPAAFAKFLEYKKATPQEWDDALLMYGVMREEGAVVVMNNFDGSRARNAKREQFIHAAQTSQASQSVRLLQ